MAQMTVDIHSGRTGDVIVVSGHRVGDRERLGEVLETLGEAATFTIASDGMTATKRARPKFDTPAPPRST